MKYFSPSYWFKLWLLSAPLFNDETIGINAKSINNKKIKDWASNNTNLQSINKDMIFTNSSTNYQPYNLNQQSTNQNIDPFYQTEVEKSTHKKRHEKIRHKKQEKPETKISRNILRLNVTLIINQNDRQQYRNSFNNWIVSLVRSDILREYFNLNSLIRPEFNLNEENSLFSLNTEHYGYFRLSVNLRGEENGQSYQRNLELVFRTDNLYLQGFIVNNNYYHFDFRNVDMRRQSQAVRDGSVPLLTQIEGMQTIQLTEISPDYRDMIPTQNNNINWETIFRSFLTLTNHININTERPLGRLAISLGHVIFVTAESLRFWSIYSEILRLLIFNNEFITLERNSSNIYYSLLVSWSDESRIQYLAIDRFNEPRLGREISTRHYFTSRLDNTIREILENITNSPVNANTNLLGNTNIRVLLGIFSITNYNCRRQKRSLSNVFWEEKICDLKPQIEKIEGKTTAIHIVEKNNQNKNLREGDIFVGTTKGIYLIHENGLVVKDVNIENNEVTTITKFQNDKFYVTTKEEDVYFLNTQFVNEGNLLAEKLDNTKSSDLNKELKIFYNNNYNWKVHMESVLHHYWNTESRTLNLDKVNPIDNFQKLEFLGDVYSDGWGLKVKWGSWVYNGNKNTGHHPDDTYDLQYFMKIRDNKFNNIIENTKNQVSPNKEQKLQTFWDKDGAARIEVDQRFGLTWYWENNNYYLKVFSLQYCEWWTSLASLNCWIKMGNGIRLYNEDNNFIRLNKNLEKPKEINLFFNSDNSSFISKCDFKWESKNDSCHIKTLNLGKISPLNYQKIYFFDVKEKINSNWGTTDYSFKEINEYDFIKLKNIKNIIENEKVSNNNEEIFKNTNFVLEKKDDSSGIAGVSFDQRFGLTWYWENNNYYLQTLICQYGEAFWLGSGGRLSVDLGKGIRLYDNDQIVRSKRNIDINNLQEKSNKTVISNELKNTIKWNDDFSKQINHEQHLPITNNSNYLTNNITNL